MKKLFFLIISIALLFTLSGKSDAAMEDYCVAPSYVIQNLPLNIMIVLDNSGSMFNYAYFDGFYTAADLTDDNMCTNSASPCTEFIFDYNNDTVIDTSDAYPNYKYYGYFNSDYWYTYASGRFTSTAPKTGSGIPLARAKNNNEWDGNFLNWLTMRRVDIIRKIMTGGSSTGTGTNTRLLGAMPDWTGRGIYKQIPNIENYIDDSITTGTRCIRSDTGGAGTATFDILSVANCVAAGSTAAGGSNIGVDVNVALPAQTAAQVQVQGVVQEIAPKTRIGLTFYNRNATTPQGGRVQTSISGTSLSAIVNQINNTLPDSNTPLGETLWTVTGYFAQQETMESGPGPRYNGGDFTIGASNDPWNYGGSSYATANYPFCSKSFVLYITDGEPCQDGYLPADIADYANGKSDYNCTGNTCDAAGPFLQTTFTVPGCSGNVVAGIEDVALYAHTTDLRSSTLGVNAIDGTQNLTIYTIFAFGRGSNLLKYAAINGGFIDSNSNNQPDLQSEWDKDNNDIPDNYYESSDGAELEAAILDAVSNMISRASSGTAVSVLASGEGSGANLIQGIFYPRRQIGNDIINWSGSLQNLWYYMDPFFTNTNIREDTTQDKRLNLVNDYIVQFYFDSTSTVQKTKLRRFSDSGGDGDADTQLTAVDFENTKGLWEAGYELWKRDLGTNPRNIFTTITGTGPTLNFASATASTLRPYMDLATDTKAEYIIRYIHGYDTRCSACSAPDGLVTVDTDNDGTDNYLGVDIDGVAGDDYRSRYVRLYNNATAQHEKRVWKLGDILNSTPRIASWLRINTYDYDVPKYNDNSYKLYLETVGYKSRGMVFTGGNDGMLHAFKLGNYELPGYNWITPPAPSSTEKAAITGSDLGKEMWGFIPKNALPYLKYIADPDYCHIYTVDLTPYLVDVSIGGNPTDAKPADGSSWRTVLIGGMRTGGASRGTTTACTDVDGDGNKDCVNTPVDYGGESIGFSSYFALDVTDPEYPVFLWEFSNPELGFATTGPAVVRVGPSTENGNWFVVFGSGPTGPISAQDVQFMGRSDQNMKFFVLNLETGSLLRTIDTGIQYAFAGSMVNSTVDPDVDYSDDAVYVGYVTRSASTSRPPDPPAAATYKWTNGGVGRIVTYESSNPADWVWRPLMTDIGPVTSTIARLQNKKVKTQWLFFGTGRHFYATGSLVDDVPNRRSIFGIKEPASCFTSSGMYGSFNPDCTDTVSVANLMDVTAAPANTTEDNEGWYIDMDDDGDYTYSECQNYDNYGNCSSQADVERAYGAERVVTNPVASTTGCVFYTSYKPYDDVCALGGKTFMWAVKYNTGGDPTSCLQGKILAQVSTGSIEEINLKDAFVNRKSVVPIEGVPSQDEPPLLTTPPPVRRPMHIKER